MPFHLFIKSCLANIQFHRGICDISTIDGKLFNDDFLFDLVDNTFQWRAIESLDDRRKCVGLFFVDQRIIESKSIGRKNSVFAHKNRTLDHILKFPDVAGPIVSFQLLRQRFRIEINVYAEKGAVFSNEMRNQFEEILFTIAERRNDDFDDV